MRNVCNDCIMQNTRSDGHLVFYSVQPRLHKHISEVASE